MDIDWALSISALSLLISGSLAVREFTARPIPFGHIDKAHRHNGSEWEVIGHRIHVTNLGRRPFILEGAGALNPSGDGVSGSQTVSWPDVKGDYADIPNPICPLSIQPGEVVTFLLAPVHMKSDSRLGILIVKPRKLQWLSRRPRRSRRMQMAFARPD